MQYLNNNIPSCEFWYKKIRKTKIPKLSAVFSKTYLWARTQICTSQGNEISWRNHQKKWCTGLDFEIKAFEVRISLGFSYVLKCNGYTYQHMYKMVAFLGNRCLVRMGSHSFAYNRQQPSFPHHTTPKTIRITVSQRRAKELAHLSRI